MKKILGIMLIVVLTVLTSCGVKEEANKIVETTEEVGEEFIELVEKVEEEAIGTIEEIELEIDENTAASAATTIDFSTALVSGNGTEPFWGFSASGSTLILREASGSGPMSTTTYSSVIMTNIITGVSIATSGMSLDLILGTCSDGMSDIVYDYSSTFVAGVINYTGCANID